MVNCFCISNDNAIAMRVVTRHNARARDVQLACFPDFADQLAIVKVANLENKINDALTYGYSVSGVEKATWTVNGSSAISIYLRAESDEA